MGSVTYDCVFCGEENDVFVDPSGGRHQTFTKDCTGARRRPNLITLEIDDDCGEVQIQVVQEYEA